jgi:hypothetical protein
VGVGCWALEFLPWVLGVGIWGFSAVSFFSKKLFAIFSGLGRKLADW